MSCHPRARPRPRARGRRAVLDGHALAGSRTEDAPGPRRANPSTGRSSGRACRQGPVSAGSSLRAAGQPQPGVARDEGGGRHVVEDLAQQAIRLLGCGNDRIEVAAEPASGPGADRVRGPRAPSGSCPVIDTSRRRCRSPAVTAASASTVRIVGPTGPGAEVTGRARSWRGAALKHRPGARRRRTWCDGPIPVPEQAPRSADRPGAPGHRGARVRVSACVSTMAVTLPVAAFSDAGVRFTRRKAPSHGTRRVAIVGRGAVGLRPGGRQDRPSSCTTRPPPGPWPTPASTAARSTASCRTAPAPSPPSSWPSTWGWPPTSTTSTPPAWADRAGRCSSSTPWPPSPRARSTPSSSPTGRRRGPT